MLALTLAVAMLGAPAAPSPERTASRIVDALRAGDIHLLSGAVDPETREEWIDVVDLIERSHCVSVDRFDTFASFVTPSAAQVAVIVDGFSESAGTPRRRTPLPRAWIVELARHDGEWRIRSAKTEERLEAMQILGANDDPSRACIADSARNPRAVLRIAAELMSRRGDALQANEALDRFLEERAASLGDEALVAIIRRMFSRALIYNHQPQRSIDEARHAVTMAKESGDPDAIADSLYALGMSRWISGDGDGATEAWKEGAELVDVMRDPRSAIRCVYMQSFTPDTYARLALADKTEQLSKRYGWTEGMINAQFSRGDGYRFARDVDAAASVYRAIMKDSEAILQQTYERIAVIGLAECEMANSHRAAALRLLEKAWRENYPDRQGIALDLGALFMEQHRFREAQEKFGWVIDDALKSGDPSLAAQATLSMAHIDREEGHYQQALDRLARIPEVLRQPQSRRTGGFPEWAAAMVAGETLRGLGRTDEAIARFREAIDAIESMRMEMSAGAFGRSQFFEDKVRPYVGLMEILVSKGRNAEALAVSERIKARSLTETLLNGGVDLSASMTAEERQNEKSLEEELQRLNVARLRGESVQRELEVARSRLDRFTADLYARHPDVRLRRVDTQADPLANLPPGATILDYVLGERQTTLFVIRRGAVVAHVIPVGAEELQRRVKRVVQLIAGRNERYARESQALYRTLVAPAHIDGAATIGVIPDGVLWELPFQALRTGGEHDFIDKAPIFYAASLTALSRAIEKKPLHRVQAQQLLAIGDPKLTLSTRTAVQSIMRDSTLGALPDAGREVRTIGRMYGKSSSTVITADQSSESEFKALAPKYRILHLAAHALRDDSQPMFSCVLLGRHESDPDDGILEARELIDMKLPDTDLTVLSACDTGRGGITAGEGIIGLTWAFLVAGSRTTVASQWSVASNSTAALMIELHRHLLRGEPPPTALRNAELSVRKNPRFAHPFYWAPFVVVGAPR